MNCGLSSLTISRLSLISSRLDINEMLLDRLDFLSILGVVVNRRNPIFTGILFRSSNNMNRLVNAKAAKIIFVQLFRIHI